MSKIKILAIPSDSHGVGKYRIIDPYTFIGDKYSDEVHVDIVFDVPDQDDYFTKYDIVVFHSFIHKNSHEQNIKRIKWLKTNGIKVIMDTDDFWRVDRRHPNYETFQRGELAKKRVELLRLSDHITTTTPIYANTIKQLLGLKNISIFPNAVNENEPQFQSKPIKSDKVRFGWLGGSSHLHDIELMKSGISMIQNQYKDETQFVLCGFDLRGNMREINKLTGEVNTRPIKPNETVWYKYEKIFTNDYKSLDPNYTSYLNTWTKNPYEGEFDQPYVRRWTLDINKYASNYNYFDVSLAPLVKSEFNKNKSQLKVIEAGFHKKALIATQEDPYTIDLIDSFDRGVFKENGNALLVKTSKNHKQWAQQMKRLIENPNLIEDLGNKLYETVKDKYSLSTVSKNRVELFKTIINKN
jgi:glycosyltransferase involved in cell wall biosynthesis